MASLFGRNKVRALGALIPADEVADALAIIATWHHDFHHGSLRRDKESSREQSYNRDIFLDVLGYKEKPNDPFSFEPKATTQLRQFPDALLSFSDASAATVNIAAVVELKSASVPLDRPQQREGHLSPVQQGFKYKPQYPSCPFVIVSNFYELRLYNDTQLDYESWTLDELVDSAEDYHHLRRFLLLLKAESLTVRSGKSRTQELLNEVRVEQEVIGKAFYSEYRKARLELLRDLYRNNELVRVDIDLGISKAQKLIDRIVFCCFAEDRGLLPDNTIERVLSAASLSSFGGSLWSTFRAFFEAVDKGSDRLEIPDGYNGGLFAPDRQLNELLVSDAALRGVATLSRYDFAEDLGVTILGHIFEQSISDLEDIKDKVRVSRAIPTIESVGKRKQDGIYYTPDYVVRYIVDNTLGSYLRDKERECKESVSLTQRLGEAGYEARERAAYLKYQDVLQRVRVLDPACGSGAFLVHVFDYLVAENKRVDDILGGSLTSGDEYVRDILRNNLYGVDLNGESVEITKLSLWLKTAQKGKKLTTLDRNLEVGNSIIADEALVGEKAFDWERRFPEVFEDGGFDVVVGNPPYGVKFTPEEKRYLAARDPLAPDYEIYVYFISLLKTLVKADGYLGYIFPNTFFANVFGIKYRTELLTRFQLSTALDLSRDPTFADAAVRTVVANFKNARPVANTLFFTMDDVKNPILFADYSQPELIKEVSNLLALFTRTAPELKLLEKVRKNSVPLSTMMEISQGLIPYDKYRGHDEATVKNRIFHSVAQMDASFKPELKGGDVSRYRVRWNGATWIKYGPWLAAPREPRFFREDRILVREITEKRLYCARTNDEYYNTPSIINCIPIGDVRLSALVAIMNSRLLGWYHLKSSPKAAKGLFPKVLVGDVRSLPIMYPKDPEALANLADWLRDSVVALAEMDQDFKRLLSARFTLTSWPRSLNEWWLLDFKDVVRALPKSKVPLSMMDELMKFTDLWSGKYRALLNQTTDLERRVDAEVYKLYRLSDSEIHMIESF